MLTRTKTVKRRGTGGPESLAAARKRKAVPEPAKVTVAAKREEEEVQLDLDLPLEDGSGSESEDEDAGTGIKPSRHRSGLIVYENSDVIVTYLTAQTVESAWVSAVVDIWNEQTAKRQNSYPHPRGQLVRAILKAIEHNRIQQDRASFVDRGVRGLGDGYNLEQLEEMNRIMLEKNDR